MMATVVTAETLATIKLCENPPKNQHFIYAVKSL
jgi:hypothetical protein